LANVAAAVKANTLGIITLSIIIVAVKIAFAVEMSEDDVKKEIDRNLVLIRENIYFLLRNKSVTVFKNKRALNRVASEIAVSLNRSIQSGAVLNTYVTRLTIQ